ncbi:MAG: hypothetical protein LBR34_06565 [Prevotella sp.]|jgi:hypothetical protein|nr:hypothetical protein [Prevotella sp.]
MRKAVHFLGHIVFALAAVALFSALVLWLWNALVPEIFGAASINYWQALGLLVLSRLLFGGFGGKFGGMKRRKHQLREKWLSMTPEERKEFIKKHYFGHGCGRDFFDSPNTEKQD